MSTRVKIPKEATKEQKAFIQKQANYWQEERALNDFLAGEKSALRIAKELKANYENTIKEIEDKINAFYGRYATESGMNLRTAKQYLNRNELRNFKAYIDKMLRMGDKNNFSASELQEFNRLYNKAKITRLEELEASIRGELDNLTSFVDERLENFLMDTYEDGYYKSVYRVKSIFGMDKAFSSIDRRVVELAVNKKWNGANYSDNVWGNNKNTLMKLLNTEIPRGLTLGYNPKKLAKEVSKRIGIDYNNTVRVIRTEYAKIQNDASIEGYKAAGIEKYKILAALDERTCDVCGDVFNGKVFDVDEAQTGLNFPPFHPNCRCVTEAVIENELDELTKQHAEEIGFITYEDWKNGLVKLQNGKLLYKGIHY